MKRLIKKIAIAAVAVVMAANLVYAAPNANHESQDVFGCNPTATGKGPLMCTDETGQVVNIVCGEVRNGNATCTLQGC